MSRPETHEDELRGVPHRGNVLDAKYRFESVLGVDATTATVVATHLGLEEKVAIKVLLPEWAGDPALVERFLLAGRAAARVHGEHVVQVLDVDEAGSIPFVVLEYLEGKNLEELVVAQGALRIASAVDLVLQTCEALAEAHVAGVIHGALQPGNLFLCRRADGSPCVKVMNFGLFEGLFGTSDELGRTPTARAAAIRCASPEQLGAAASVDQRTDIWSLGTILHVLLAGTAPFQAETMADLLGCILRESPPDLTRLRADVPVKLADAVLRCLAKDPAHRFTNVAELARAVAPFGPPEALASAERIGRIVEGGIDTGASRVSPRPPIPAIAPSADAPDDLPPTPMKSRGGAVALVAVAIVLLVGGVGWKILDQARSIREPWLATGARMTWSPEEALAIPPAPALTSQLPTTSAVIATTTADAPSATPVVASPAPARRLAPARHLVPHLARTLPRPGDDNPY